MRDAKYLWDNFPRKETLNQEHVRNIDLIFFCLHDTLNRNETSDAAEEQIQKLLRCLHVAFEILMA